MLDAAGAARSVMREWSLYRIRFTRKTAAYLLGNA
jgi:hypothetical protein